MHLLLAIPPSPELLRPRPPGLSGEESRSEMLIHNCASVFAISFFFIGATVCAVCKWTSVDCRFGKVLYLGGGGRVEARIHGLDGMSVPYVDSPDDHIRGRSSQQAFNFRKSDAFRNLFDFQYPAPIQLSTD